MNLAIDKYALAYQDAIDKTETMGKLFSNIQDKTLSNYAKKTALGDQLYQVARLIYARKLRKAERDFFILETGGWDTHVSDPAMLFEKLDEDIAEFVSAMKAFNVWKDVTIITTSDFGRTLRFNGRGTDHAWGSNHIIMGGDVNGGISLSVRSKSKSVGPKVRSQINT